MVELATAWLVNYGLITAVGTVSAFIVGWILKKIPTDKWAKAFQGIGEKQGRAVTAFCNSKLPKLWNGVIKPVFIDTVDALILAWVRGFILGLKSDNQNQQK